MLALGAEPTAAQVVSGPATVLDGRSLDLTGVRIRLFGIDSPEARQVCERGGQPWTCGADAAALLKRFVDAGNVDCVGGEQEPEGWLSARCSAGGVDLGQAMVAAGLAVVLPDGQGDYADAEQRARQHGLGLWGAKFTSPAEWRAAHPGEVRPAKVAAAPARRNAPAKPRIYRNEWGCAIKGNRNRQGEWIYHLPGTKFYEGTRAEEFFCTEAKAQEAGYRPAMYRDN